MTDRSGDSVGGSGPEPARRRPIGDLEGATLIQTTRDGTPVLDVRGTANAQVIDLVSEWLEGYAESSVRRAVLDFGALVEISSRAAATLAETVERALGRGLELVGVLPSLEEPRAAIGGFRPSWTADSLDEAIKGG